MPRVRLIHWKYEEVAERAARLRQAGFTVSTGPVDGEALKKMRRRPPDAVVIDLSRLPSQGRDLALALRESKALRGVPVVFVGGDAKKIPGVKRVLPEAAYTPWARIGAALRDAIANPPQRPVRKTSRMAGYSGTPLPKKLGIKPDFKVALVGAPPGFEKTVGELPAGARLDRGGRGKRDLTIWFPRSLADLDRRVEAMAAKVPDGGMWIAWPKKASGKQTDLSEREVRRAGLAAGLVDFKICAIDETWSGLKFARRKSTR